MDREEILFWLKETDTDRLTALYRSADEIRRKYVGDAVHLRGLAEISNYCVRCCAYCGLQAGNREIPRYRMSTEEILECAQSAVGLGYGTLVMQAGEDYGLETAWMAEIIRHIKQNTPLAVTLSLGERPPEDLACWREAGADRYLLRFETSDQGLYRRIHPSLPHRLESRIDILHVLKKIGYETGSGIMVGIPGQTYSTLVNDLILFQDLDLDMIGIGPYLPHPNTDLGRRYSQPVPYEEEQVPNSEEITYKMVALARILCPQANIPSTTALATLNKVNGRELGLTRGANVVMPNLTPARYRELYEIYPSKACIEETAEQCSLCLQGRIESIGRGLGRGPGARQKQVRRR